MGARSLIIKAEGFHAEDRAVLVVQRECGRGGQFYLSVFKDARILETARYTAAGPGPEGAVLVIYFELRGEKFIAINAGPEFPYTPAVSFTVECETQEEVDYYWDKLLAGGKPMQCGWLTDKYGLAWQIVPDILPKLMADPDRKKAERATRAMFKMVKLDIEALKKAAAAA